MTPAPDKTKTLSNTHRAAEAIRQRIFSGDLPPGSDHLETELADELGMSRTPVREAVLVLETQGLLTVRPRKGVRILPVSPDDMEEIYEVLTALESLAAGRAAERGYSAEDLADLAQAIDAMDTAIAAKDREAWAKADDAFHRELVRLGGNSRSIEIVDRLADQVRRARLVTLNVRPLPVKSNEDHRAVMEAIARGDAEVAVARHTRHRDEARQVLVALLKRLGLRKI
ncbi:GntR family transcriptional regulator [Gymnodinialimonas sp. 2305UL16-5]|uniref:GntR family transcriptional regulator n=1 Tax=Gymnodinialimonas mytili TaxID=3126503 RepID=UPI0030B21880